MCTYKIQILKYVSFMIYHVLLSSFVLIANVFCNGHINSTNYLPIYLVENKGQLDVSIIYYINGHDKDIYFYKKLYKKSCLNT